MSGRLAAGITPLPTSPVITPGSRHSIGAVINRWNPGAPATGANPFATNEMLAFPFTLTAPVTNVNKVFWVNGSAAGGNSSIAIYNADFVRLAQTGSTAGSGASVPQIVSLATKLGPGLYYLALAHDSTTTNRFFRWSVTTFGAGLWKSAGCFKQASITVGSLPATATPAACTSVGFPVFGLITRTVFDV